MISCFPFSFSPWLHAEPFCARLQALRLPGVTFNPYRYVAGVAPYAGAELDGIRLSVTNPDAFRPVATSVFLLHELRQVYGLKRVWRHDGARPEWFDKLYGTSTVRRALVAGVAPSEITAAWRPAQRAFRARRAQALLYP